MLFRNCILLFFLGWFSSAVGQVDEPPARPIPLEIWNKALRRLDYSSDVQPPQHEVPPSLPQEERSPELWDTDLLWDGAKLALIVLLLSSVGYWIYGLVLGIKDRTLNDEAPAQAANTQTSGQYWHFGELSAQLQQAVASGDYRQATRLHFLLALEHLAKTGALAWSQEKTNSQYVREMRNHPQASNFQRAAWLYESVWYGKTRISRKQYEAQVAPLLEDLLARRR